MTATEMHDLLQRSYMELLKQPTFRPGEYPGFEHIKYCRYCGAGEAHAAEHGHSSRCLITELAHATGSSEVRP